MYKSITIHFSDKPIEANYLEFESGTGQCAGLTIMQDEVKQDFILPPNKIAEFVDAITGAFYDKNYSALEKETEQLEIKVDKLNENIDYLKQMREPNEADQHEMY